MKLASVFVGSLVLSCAAQSAVVTTNDGATLVSALFSGSGLLIDQSTVSVVGLSTQSGTHSGLTFAGNGTSARPALSIGAGIVLSSGNAIVPAFNSRSDYSADTSTGSSATISTITGLSSFDQNKLAFNFSVASGITSISTQFIFGSDEFPEFAGSKYADGFAFVVDGVNYAKFADGSVVSLLSLLSNSNLYDNSASAYPIEYDGLTSLLKVTGLLDPTRSVHSLEIVVADTGDTAYDSAVYLSTLAGGTAAPGGGGITPGGGGGSGGGAVPEPGTILLVGLALAGVVGTDRSKRKRSALPQ